MLLLLYTMLAWRDSPQPWSDNVGKNADQTPAHVCQHLRQQPAAESSAKRSDYSRLIEEVSPSTLSTLSTLYTLNNYILSTLYTISTLNINALYSQQLYSFKFQHL